MIKRMGTCLPKDGINRDDFWAYHKSTHAPDILRVSENLGFERYVMSRVSTVMRGNPRFYDLTEIWYEDEQAMRKCNEVWRNTIAPSGKNIEDDFDSWVKENCSFVVNRLLLKDDSPKNVSRLQMNRLVKRAVSCSLKASVNPEHFLKYVREVLAPSIMQSDNLRLKKYVMSHVIQVVSGKENQRFQFLMEMWWDTEKDMIQDYENWNNTQLSSGGTVFTGLDKLVSELSDFTMEEFIVKEYSLRE